MTRRILSVWLPHWPITRLSRSASPSPDRPLVTIETSVASGIWLRWARTARRRAFLPARH